MRNVLSNRMKETIDKKQGHSLAKLVWDYFDIFKQSLSKYPKKIKNWRKKALDFKAKKNNYKIVEIEEKISRFQTIKREKIKMFKIFIGDSIQKMIMDNISKKLRPELKTPQRMALWLLTNKYSIIGNF